ncbi:sensor histidine kinase [Paenibacillus sp. GCM10012306]|uniref:sensor histidine kinase n=1 Tax=Paenibacillus sp. GCM10012306 TaxID=3317342 RepID=UPI0036D3F0BE
MIKFVFERMHKRRQSEDMFVKMRNRLTIMYSGMLVLFLLVFIIIVYSSLFWMVSYQQKKEVNTLADQKLLESQNLLKSDMNGNDSNVDGIKKITLNNNYFFYYVYNQQGELIAANETIPDLRQSLLQMLKDWSVKYTDVNSKTENLTYSENGNEFWRQKDSKDGNLDNRGWEKDLQNNWDKDTTLTVSSGKKIHMAIMARIIYDGDQRIGKMYLGQDTTYYWTIINWMLTIFIGLAILFFIISFLVGSSMSKRAMVPIIKSYTQQRHFVADASHELRTPLSILNSSIDVLELEEGENISEFSRNVLMDMKDEVKRMATLVNDLLSLARSDAGLTNISFETFDFIPIVEQLDRSIQPLAVSRHIKLNLHTPADLLVSGDKERLKQLLYILLDNAIKYTPQHGTVNLFLSMVVNDDDESLLIQVQDTGIGIQPADQKKIFDRFYRVDKNRTKKIEGTGIGLAIAKWIVEEHKGTIQLSSHLGEGSVFTVKIPQISRK